MVNAVRSIRTFWYKWAGVQNNKDIVDRLAMFSPNSSGTLQALAGLALQSAQETFPLLSSLVAGTRSQVVPRPVESMFPACIASRDATELAELFNRYESDKSSDHNYHLLYAPLLTSRRADGLRLLEVGIGSNKLDVVSSIGVEEDRALH